MSDRTGRGEDRRPSSSPCTIEHLEPRRLMAANLVVENLDVIPGYERLIFNRIRNPDTEFPNYVKDRGTLRLTNSGDQTLRISDYQVSGPFKVLGMPPMSIPAGKSVTMTVQFTATTPPPFTYNQTNGTGQATKAGAHIGALTFKTNAPNAANYSEGLAGWFQTDSEKDQEPNLQTFINLISDYKTNIAPNRTVYLTQPENAPQYYGEEVVSGYWQAADPSKQVRIRQLASFHSQGEVVRTYWFDKPTKNSRLIMQTAGLAGQTFLPYIEGQKGNPATVTFAPGNTIFGVRIDNEYSDDAMNKNQSNGGHHVRFYPVRDHFGNILQNSYFVAMDYSVAGSQNNDFQDNIFIISNVKPAGN